MEPKYQWVADVLRREIASGIFRDGQALLTELELKERFGVSRQTIRQAISLLEGDGLVCRRRGSGTYVTHGPRKHGSVLNVAVVTTYITDYIFPSIVRGIESVLSTQNCIMSLSATYNSVERERALLRRLLETPVDGLIVEGTQTALPNPNIGLYEKLRERNIPFVFINGYYPELSQAVHVVTDDEAGGFQAAEILLEAGLTRLGGIFKSDDMQGHMRHQGFEKALKAHGLCAAPENVCWFTTENKPRFLLEEPGLSFLRDVSCHLDGLVCYNDEVALRTLEHLAQIGLQVPRDLSLVSFDNSAYAGICSPKLTSLSHPKETFGQEAAAKLLKMMQGYREESTVLGWELVRRESVRG